MPAPRNETEVREMRNIIVGAAVAAIVAGGTMAVAPRADAAGTPGCMTKPEYSRIHRGQTPAKVAAIVGASGKVTLDDRSPGYRFVSKSYRVCGSRYGSAYVAWSTTEGNGAGSLGVYAKGWYA